MRIILLVFPLFLFYSCAKDPVSSSITDNPGIEAELLFTHEGCKIFRFRDSGHLNYFTTCDSVTYKRSQSCGKNCNTTKIITNQTKHTEY